GTHVEPWAGLEQVADVRLPTVALSEQEGFDGGDIVLMDENIQVTKGAQGEIAVYGSREDRAFVRNSSNALGRKEVQEGEQFAGQAEVVPGVGLEKRAELCQDWLRHSCWAGGLQTVIEEWYDLMTGRCLAESCPVNPVLNECSYAPCGLWRYPR